MDTLAPQTPDLLELLYIFIGGAGLTAVVALLNHWPTHRRQKHDTEVARVLTLLELASDDVVKNYEDRGGDTDQRNEKRVAECNRYRTQLEEVTDKWRVAAAEMWQLDFAIKLAEWDVSQRESTLEERHGIIKHLHQQIESLQRRIADQDAYIETLRAEIDSLIRPELEPAGDD